MHALDPLKYWNEFNGMLFVNQSKTRWILIDYHENDKERRALTINGRNERTRVRSEQLWGMLKFVGGLDPTYLVSGVIVITRIRVHDRYLHRYEMMSWLLG